MELMGPVKDILSLPDQSVKGGRNERLIGRQVRLAIDESKDLQTCLLDGGVVTSIKESLRQMCMAKIDAVKLRGEAGQRTIEGPVPRTAEIKQMVTLLKPSPWRCQRKAGQQEHTQRRTESDTHIDFSSTECRKKIERRDALSFFGIAHRARESTKPEIRTSYTRGQKAGIVYSRST